MAWMQLLQVNGFVEQLLGFNLAQALYSFPGLVAVMALHLFPMIYVAASQALNLIGERYEEVAVVFGARRLSLFWRIQLPLLSISLLASALVVFTLTLEEYGTPEILGSRFGFHVLVTAIAAKFSDWPIDLPGASVLSLMLIALALIAFNVQRYLANRFGSAIEQPKLHSSAASEHALGRIIAQLVFAVSAVLAVGLPLASVAGSAFTATLSGGLAWQNFSTRHVAALLQLDSPAWAALQTSLTLALLAAVCSVVVAVLVAFVLIRLRTKGAAVLDFLALLPNALPGMTIAVGLILVWNQRFWPVTPYNHAAILLIAYVCLTLPYPIRTISATLRQLPNSLDEAGYISGANEVRVILKLLLPLLAPSALASGLIVFAISTRELVSSLMLAPPGIETVATYVFHQFDQGSINAGMAMSLVTILLSGSIMAFGQHLQRRPTL
jgi:iron(III) transport system permease protein